MTPLLKAEGIGKRFPGTIALDNVQLSVNAGEIHAVMGENGAGKSTLMKILAGVITADSGEIQFEGNPIRPTSPREALELGIAIVHQELSMVSTLTVAENIYPGRLPTNLFGLVRYGQLFKQAHEVLNQLDVKVDPRVPVGSLSIATQQLVEITKAVSSDCKILILDEPTSALTDRESDMLLDFLRQLASTGVGILYISHKLKEIFQVADRVTVLRDGKYVGTQVVSEIEPDDVIRMMVGRELGTIYPPKSAEITSPLMEIQGIRLPGSPVSNSFQLFQGEILGFAGLIGSGRSELMRAIFGVDPKAEGRILLNGAEVHINSARSAIQHGLGYLPEDRKSAGLFLDMSVRLNIESTVLNKVSTNGFVSYAKERTLAGQYVDQLNISTPGIEQDVRRLSGGNQQKALVAKWLATQPKIFIVDEPTRGIDVGAKKEIHFLLRSLASQGVGVIMISSELPEVMGMSDRILVMHEGAIVDEIDSTAATEEEIIRSASGHHVRK